MKTDEQAVDETTAFPSGPWAGYYLQSSRPGRHRMDIDLRFHDGLIDGSGIDDIAPFTIRGRYDREKLEVWWTKRYPTHDVFYRGFREGRGIWGTWEIGVFDRGGFMIWPRGVGEGAEARVEAETEAPDAVAPVAPAGPGAPPLAP